MVKFFRKIRQRLITENKFSKYLLYAVGEIMLVVIGILIALQVNNWNQKQILQKETGIILTLLHEEFKENKILLSQTLSYWKRAHFSTEELLYQCTLSEPNYSETQIDSIFNMVFSNPPYFPNQAVYEDLLNNGKLRLINNHLLKSKLFIWKTTYGYLEDRFNYSVKIAENFLTPYLYKNVSLKNWEFAKGSRKDKSQLTNRVMDIFHDLEFENMIGDRVYVLKRGINIMEEELNPLIDEIIEMTKPH